MPRSFHLKIQPMQALCRLMYCLVVVLLTAAAAAAQVFVLSAGSSTLYQADGGGLQVHGRGYNASLGMGVVAGRFVGGAKLVKSYRGSLYTAGSQTILVNLPTDVFNADHYLYTLGASVKTKVRSADVFAFAGATSRNFGSPYFDGLRAEDPAAVFLAQKPLGESLTVGSEFILSRRITAIGSLAWAQSEHLKLGFAAGTGASEPYGAVSALVTRSWINVKAAYILAGKDFRRTSQTALLIPEPNRENVQVDLRPFKFLTLSGGRQNYLVPQADTDENVKSSVDNGSVNFTVAGVGLNATFFRSMYANRNDKSKIFSASRRIASRIQLGASYLENQPDDGPSTSAVIGNVQEFLTPRWSLNQVVSRSNGQTNGGMGGSFLSNLLTASVDYETYYVPTRIDAPFQQALILDVQINIRGIALHGGTFVSPTGDLLYSADARTVLSRNREPSFQSSMGKMVLRGQVVDTDGHPVAGAMVMVDALVLYTDSDGRFLIHERKKHAHSVHIVVDQFLNGGQYRVVSCPSVLSSGANDEEPEAVIVVARVTQ